MFRRAWLMLGIDPLPSPPFFAPCQAIAQTMGSVFKELLDKTVRQGLGPSDGPSAGTRSPKLPACHRHTKSLGFLRSPGAPALPSESHPQSLDPMLKPH